MGIKCKKWDKKLVGGIDTYHINNVGNSENLYATKYDDYIKIYEAKVKVETIGVEKANTIAIYETNGTVFNGHYQEQERMNIIQLYVNDSGSGTPFEEGLNTIVIPTSLFTETVFNARVQNETLSETPIYSDDEEIFKFISVGRDGNTEQACEEIDFIIIRFDISSEDAMEVLNLLLECLVNDTTNETAIVYSYVSTKQNGTAAVMMNLPFSVLGLIPWNCSFENSPMGSKPETFEDWFWKPLKTIGMVIVGVIITIGMGFAELFTMMVDFFKDILMDILPILAYILWLIIRVLLLVFIWIMFAVTLLVVGMGLLTISLIIIPFGNALEINVTNKMSCFKIQKQDLIVTFGYGIRSKYSKLIGFTIPLVYFYINKGNTTIEIPYSFSSKISTPKFELQEDFYDFPNVTKSEPSSSEENLKEIFTGMSFMMSLFGGGMGIVGITVNFPSENEIGKMILAYLSLALWTFGIISLAIYSLDNEKDGYYLSDEFIMGVAIGCCISGLVAASVANKWSKISFWNYVPYLSVTLGIASKIFSEVGKQLPEDLVLPSIIDILFGSISLIFGWISLRGIGLSISPARDIFAMVFMFLGFGLSIFCALYPIFRRID